jgi:hypothetical protein
VVVPSSGHAFPASDFARHSWSHHAGAGGAPDDADRLPASDGDDPRTLRLFDLVPHETVSVRCGCGRIIEYGADYFQRRYRLPSGMLVFDLRYRLRCAHGTRRRGFRISVIDNRNLEDLSKPRVERVIVEQRG